MAHPNTDDGPDAIEDHRLFVYGTLGPGRPNAHIMDAIGGTWQKARVRGVLHQEGWGAAMGYPAIELRGDAPYVDGFVFTSAALPDHWGELDSFEGDAYARVLTAVELDSGAAVRAYIYTLKQE